MFLDLKSLGGCWGREADAWSRFPPTGEAPWAPSEDAKGQLESLLRMATL